jgi:hypothetical protein
MEMDEAVDSWTDVELAEITCPRAKARRKAGKSTLPAFGCLDEFSHTP